MRRMAVAVFAFGMLTNTACGSSLAGHPGDELDGIVLREEVAYPQFPTLASRTFRATERDSRGTAVLTSMDWAHTYPGFRFQSVEAVAVDSEGRIVVAFWGFSYSSPYSLTLLKLSAGGQVLWSKTFEDSVVHNGKLSIDPAGSIYLSGIGHLGGVKPPHSTGFLAKFSVDGTPLWHEALGWQVFGHALTPEGDVFVVVRDHEDGATVARAILYKPDGSQLWIREVPGRAFRHAEGYLDLTFHAAAVNGAGRLYIAGVATSSFELDGVQIGTPGVLQTFVLRFEPSGELSWADSFPGASGTLKSIVVSDPDTIVLLGELYGELSLNGTVLKQGPTESGQMLPYLLAVSPDGSGFLAPLGKQLFPSCDSLALSLARHLAYSCLDQVTELALDETPFRELAFGKTRCEYTKCGRSARAVAFGPSNELVVAGVSVEQLPDASLSVRPFVMRLHPVP